MPKRQKATLNACETPTTALLDLTTAGAKMLEAVADPANRHLPVTQLAEKAGVSRQWYYKLMASRDFREAVQQILMAAANDDMSEVIDMLVASSKIPGKDGHADRKLLLEMTGMYQPTRRNINEDAGKPTVAEAEMARVLLQYGVHEGKWPPVLLARYKAGMIEGVAKPVESKEVNNVRETQG
jgi:hypothetical protein